MIFPLPEAVKSIAAATKKLREQYKDGRLTFTPDGKLVGDLGEAVAAEMFDLKLEAQNEIDGFAQNGTLPVQIKATGREKGSVYFRAVRERKFRNVWLVVLRFDWENATVELVYSGNESDVRRDHDFTDGKQRPVSLSSLRKRERLDGLPISDRFLARYPQITA